MTLYCVVGLRIRNGGREKNVGVLSVCLSSQASEGRAVGDSMRSCKATQGASSNYIIVDFFIPYHHCPPLVAHIAPPSVLFLSPPTLTSVEGVWFGHFLLV
jgi:hypothetical protein